jgi:hypothetical protein
MTICGMVSSNTVSINYFYIMNTARLGKRQEVILPVRFERAKYAKLTRVTPSHQFYFKFQLGAPLRSLREIIPAELILLCVNPGAEQLRRLQRGDEIL